MNKDTQIVIFCAKDGRTSVEVNLRQETLWLSLQQIADLFERDKSVISRHIANIFKTKELTHASTVAKNATVQMEGGHPVERAIEYYNLDLILSVGYRVNSKRGTQFRIWATQILRDHLLKGYTVNERRLREQVTRLKELQATVDLLGRVIQERRLTGDEAESLLKVVTDYSLALSLLDQYDHQQLTIRDTTSPTPFALTSCISSSRTTHSWTATNASPPSSSSGSWTPTAFCTVRTAPSAWLTTRWLLSHS